MTRDQYLGAIVGSACGDMIGRATEFMNEVSIFEYYGGKIRDIQPDRYNMFEYGEWTDDTYLMLCIADSIAENKEFDIYDLKDRFCEWYKNDGRDCGNLTATAIELMNDGFEPIDSGKHAWEMSGKHSAPNGGLMRNTPIALAYANDFDKMLEITEKACKITHFDNRCVLSCFAHSIALYSIINNKNIFDMIWAYCGERDNEFDDVLYEARDCKINEFNLSGSDMGYTYLSLKTALSAIFNYDNYTEPILEIINKGGDSDTNACIAGGLLGAKFGADSIPQEWQNAMIGYSRLYQVANSLYDLNI